MGTDKINQIVEEFGDKATTALSRPETYTQLGIVLAIYAVAFILANRIRHYIPLLGAQPDIEGLHPLRKFAIKFGNVIFPLLAILMLRVSVELSESVVSEGWLVRTAMIVAVLLLFNSVVDDFVSNKPAARLLKWLGMPLLFLHMIGVLSGLIEILESISISIGNIRISAYGIVRVAIFGSLLFWMGRVSSRTGREVIAKQENLDLRTREVASKLLEAAIFLVVSLVLLQIMGINLTALAVFGGALGVGIGFGLQAIASNFISGIIILLDRSVSIGDYVELEDGRTGTVRELSMRSTTLETFDGKDIVVPNEKFIVAPFTNWTHKDKRQRYRVDFSVAYRTDIRKLVDVIKKVVAEHPQVISGEDIPIEERPDCEIDSFGDSGVNMFVEFWMEGIDDGKNRVGGDLLLSIFEAMREHGYEIPFPQREVRVLNNDFSGKQVQ
jgi:small-conductance mechanosensitive channel